jgi:hypothetical protein
MNGGWCDMTGDTFRVSLSFRSIRSLEFHHNYETFVTAISAFQIITTGKNAIYNTLKVGRKHVRILSKLIANEVSSSTIDLSHNYALFYVQQLFHSCLQSMRKLAFFIPAMNQARQLEQGQGMGQGFLKFAPLFFDFYSLAELHANANEWKVCVVCPTRSIKNEYHSNGFVNPIKSVKLGIFLDLCPNVKEIEIIALPIKRYFMNQLLNIIIDLDHDRVQIQSIFICDVWAIMRDMGNYPWTQSDFSSFAECVREYQMQFQNNNWSMKFKEDNSRYGIEIRKL